MLEQSFTKTLLKAVRVKTFSRHIKMYYHGSDTLTVFSATVSTTKYIRILFGRALSLRRLCCFEPFFLSCTQYKGHCSTVLFERQEKAAQLRRAY